MYSYFNPNSSRAMAILIGFEEALSTTLKANLEEGDTVESP